MIVLPLTNLHESVALKLFTLNDARTFEVDFLTSTHILK
jgi:hypothetical protein